jgi:hypothetical protein
MLVLEIASGIVLGFLVCALLVRIDVARRARRERRQEMVRRELGPTIAEIMKRLPTAAAANEWFGRGSDRVWRFLKRK